MRRAAKPDANRSGIVRDLKLMGIAVYDLKMPVDLLCNFRGVNYLVEIKNLDGKNTLTQAQKDFIESWPGPVHIVRNTDEAIKAICGERVMA